ncbi:MAG: nitroreductase [Parcubacteria group bacterium]|nr:nitroreductase [Parcubacteria group bacterium]
MAIISFEDLEKRFSEAQTLETQMRIVIEAATRAPSTHNSQPWRFHFAEGVVEVFMDERVHLPYSDKETQYAHISIGFLLHHIYVIGVYLGMYPQIVVSAGRAPLATVSFSVPATRDEHFKVLTQAIFERRNRRGLFVSEPLPAALFDELAQPIQLPDGLSLVRPGIVTDNTSATRIGALTLETMERVYDAPGFRREMSHWIVPTGSGRRDGIPGYSLNQPFVLSWILPHLIRSLNIGKIPGKMSASALASAPAIFAFGAPADPAAWISIGFKSSHIILTLVARGFDASVYVATAELPEIRDEVTALCGLDAPLRFLFAAGKLQAPPVKWTTPRVSFKQKLI